MRKRRAAPVLLAMLGILSACSREADFDKRYDDASAKMSEMARDIDAQVAATSVPSSTNADESGLN